jgi:putative transposase
MPEGLKRFHHSRQSHFITFTCYHRLPKLHTSEVRDLVVAALEHARVSYHFRTYGLVIMPEHVHLLISELDRATIVQAVQSFKIASSKWVARSGRHEQGQPLWQKRYYDRNLRDYQEFVDKPRYLHRNPVKRGLCS